MRIISNGVSFVGGDVGCVDCPERWSAIGNITRAMKIVRPASGPPIRFPIIAEIGIIKLARYGYHGLGFATIM
tara:strand:- start:86 stop:304 length:219 start_codon:yes stop_codon:yes gene_type:complete